jgi:hypothetical protein
MPHKTIGPICNRKALQRGMDKRANGEPAARSLTREQYEASNRKIAEQLALLEAQGLMPDPRRSDDRVGRAYPTHRGLHSLLEIQGSGYYHGGFKRAARSTGQ